MSGKILVDTNIWVYAHLESLEDDKFHKAVRIIGDPAGLVVSVQVLNEYYSVMLKNGADDALIQTNIQRCPVWYLQLAPPPFTGGGWGVGEAAN
jgi:predicted nucleic acid-binding protein